MKASIKQRQSSVDVKFRNFRNAIGTLSLFSGDLKLFFNEEQHKNIMPTKRVKTLEWSMSRGEYFSYETIDQPDKQNPPITNRQLAMKLAKGWRHDYWQNSGSADPGGVPPRPMLKQFMAEEGKEIRNSIGNLVEYTVSDVIQTAYNRGAEVDESKMQSYIAKTMTSVGTILVDKFQQFVLAGSVYPSNAPYTVKKKGFNKPGYHTGDLIDNFEWEWVPKDMPKGLTAR